LNLQALYQNVSISRNDICENDDNSENNSLKLRKREKEEEKKRKRIRHVESPYMVSRHFGGWFLRAEGFV